MPIEEILNGMYLYQKIFFFLGKVDVCHLLEKLGQSNRQFLLSDLERDICYALLEYEKEEKSGKKVNYKTCPYTGVLIPPNKEVYL
jgi:hypothetical protein